MLFLIPSFSVFRHLLSRFKKHWTKYEDIKLWSDYSVIKLWIYWDFLTEKPLLSLNVFAFSKILISSMVLIEKIFFWVMSHDLWHLDTIKYTLILTVMLVHYTRKLLFSFFGYYLLFRCMHSNQDNLLIIFVT